MPSAIDIIFSIVFILLFWRAKYKNIFLQRKNYVFDGFHQCAEYNLMKLIVVLLALLSLLFPLSATSDSFVIPLSSSLYEEIDTLYITQGLSTPSSSRPWSAGETEKILSRLKEENLSRKEKIMLSLVEDEISELMR